MRRLQFPMSEYIKDPSAPEGWRTITYEKGKEKHGSPADTTNLNADAMSEGMDEGYSDVEPDVDVE